MKTGGGRTKSSAAMGVILELSGEQICGDVSRPSLEPPRTLSSEPSCPTPAGSLPGAGSAGYHTKTYGIKCYSPYKWVIALERALLKGRTMSVPWSYPLKLEQTPRESRGSRRPSLTGRCWVTVQLLSTLLFESPGSGPKSGSLLFQQHDFNVLSQNNFLWSQRIPRALQFK